MFHKTTCMISTYTPQWLSPTQTHTHTISGSQASLSHTQATKLSLVFRCVYVLFLRQELFAASLSFVLLNPQSALLFSWRLARLLKFVNVDVDLNVSVDAMIKLVDSRYFNVDVIWKSAALFYLNIFFISVAVFF